MKKILVPTDFSENAGNAVAYAAALAQYFPSKIILLNAFQLPYSASDMLVSVEDIMKKDSAEGLKKTLGNLKEQGISAEIEPVSVNDDAIDAIVTHSKLVDLVVMGTKGATGILDEIFGTNTLGVIKKTNTPLIVVPPGATFRKPDKIVFAADLFKISKEVILNTMTFLAKSLGAEIEILHVETETNYDMVHYKEKVKDSLNKYLSGVDHHVHTIKSKDAIEGIEKFIKTHDVKLLTMLPRKRGLYDRIFHESVSERISLHSNVPVLMLPHDQGEPDEVVD